jgi:hypothetical protein
MFEKNDVWPHQKIHYKEFFPYRPTHLRLVSKSTIFQLLMQLSFMAPWEKWLVVVKTTKKWFIVAYATGLVTNVSLDESDDEKWMYISSIFFGISK